MAGRARKYWLMKSEPDVYSIEDLEKEGGGACWDGVRNYQARNFMRDEMRKGDLVLFYHSNSKPSGVAGIARVCTKEAYPDHTQLDKKSKYYDPKATKEEPRWFMVEVEFVERFETVLSLADLKAAADQLEGMRVIKKGERLSIQPVEKGHFKKVLKMAGARTRIR
jgi:predicted RNA-binding protein with PUA-like domain